MSNLNNVFDTETKVLWKIEDGYTNSYPISSELLVKDSAINVSKENTCFPLPILQYDFSLMKSNDILLNGYPCFYFLKKDTSLNNFKQGTNLPIRDMYPLIPSTFHISPKLLDGYPITIYWDKDFINDPNLALYSNDEYLTPLQTKRFIQNYILEQVKKKVSLLSKQCNDCEVIPMNERFLLKWKDPNDENWEKTYVILREDRFATKKGEIGNVILTTTSRENKNAYKDSFFVANILSQNKKLVNGKKYYIVFAAANDKNQLTINKENKFIIAPKMTYEKIYDKDGNLIKIKEVI